MIKEHETISNYSFEDLYQYYSGYLNKMSSMNGGISRMYSIEDVRQEISIILWKCYKKYKGLDRKQFHNVFVRSFLRKVGNVFKTKYSKDMRRIPGDCWSVKNSDIDSYINLDSLSKKHKAVIDRLTNGKRVSRNDRKDVMIELGGAM